MEKKYSTEERRSMILKMLHDEQKVLIADLVKTFGVSEVSIRKDLAVLEERQLLVRVKGGAIIMHKTGTSDCDANGKWTAINDVAHVKMPDGRSYALAVFIKNSYESYAENERTIALISSIVFDYIGGN